MEDQFPIAFAKLIRTSPVVAPLTTVAVAGVQVFPEVEEPMTKRAMPEGSVPVILKAE